MEPVQPVVAGEGISAAGPSCWRQAPLTQKEPRVVVREDIHEDSEALFEIGGVIAQDAKDGSGYIDLNDAIVEISKPSSGSDMPVHTESIVPAWQFPEKTEESNSGVPPALDYNMHIPEPESDAPVEEISRQKPKSISARRKAYWKPDCVVPEQDHRLRGLVGHNLPAAPRRTVAHEEVPVPGAGKKTAASKATPKSKPTPKTAAVTPAKEKIREVVD